MTRLEPIAPYPTEPQTDATSASDAPAPDSHARRGMPAAGWSGLALAAGLIPLAALAGLRAVGPISLPDWVGSAATWVVAVAAGGATVAAIAAALRRGRVTRFLDATAMGALAASTAAAAAAAANYGSLLPGVAVGVLVAAPLLLVASLLPRPRLDPGLPRGAASVAAFLAIEATLGAALVLHAAGTAVEIPDFILAGAAAVLLAAGVAAIERPLRVLATTSGAAAAAVFMVAGPGTAEWLLALAGLLVTSVAMPLSYRFEPLTRPSGALGAAAPTGSRLPVTAVLGDPTLDAELEEARRLARELRATIEELSAARRTVELQRNEIDRLASVDALTGVSPRPAVLERLRIETAEARRYAHPFAVALLDIDGMGDLNRRHGREVGDQVLREVALRLRVRTRTADAIGRIDGDAFLAILPHTDERGATVFADAMRRLTTERAILTDAGELRVTLSIGVAIMRAELALTDDQLLTAVHEALASAKAGGGNRIAFDRLHGFARPEGPPAPEEDAAPAADESASEVPAETPTQPGADDTR